MKKQVGFVVLCYTVEKKKELSFSLKNREFCGQSDPLKLRPAKSNPSQLAM
jgi:hypothetical protein